MNNQRGFATFEAILAVTIISLLAFVAVPKIDKVIDKILLDYEMKRLCGEIEFASSLNRSAYFSPEIFNRKIANTETDIILQIDVDKSCYQLQRNGKILRDRHYLPQGMKIFCSPSKLSSLQFSPSGLHTGDSGTITLTSRRGEKVEIIFDSVGRWRGNRNVN